MGRTGRRHRRTGRLLLLGLALLVAFLLWENHALETKDFSFSSPRLPAGFDGFRIVQLSDLHGKQFGRDNRRLLSAIAEAKPDLIALTGDLADAKTDLTQIQPLAAALAAIAPTYYITGNHEWGAGIVPAVTDALKGGGVTYLSNRAVPIQRGGDTLLLAGIDDPNGHADQKTPAELAAELADLPGDPFWILLAHRNNRYPEYGELGADLILAGHGHGGLIRLPLTDGLIGTDLHLFPTWTDGFYTDFDTPLFVSRGLGNSGRTFRLFNRPELAVLTLHRDSIQK
ncbi:MAG: metallophosphoesterase [Oscillospiraceae bacterium]